MGNFTFKGMLLATVFMLLGCLSIQAGDDGLITKQITVTLDKAGTLPDKIGSAKKYKITNLKIIGEINGTDWLLIRDMAGGNSDGRSYETGGRLATLDLSEAKIVSGGEFYFSPWWTSDIAYTSKDVLGAYAFYQCTSLVSLTLPKSITEIGARAFQECSNLANVAIPASVTSIGMLAFWGCSGLTGITIPSSVTSIGSSAFYGCSGLTSLSFPSGITSIGSSAFYGCSGLTSLSFPSGITSIGSSAFYGCSGLTSLSFPSGIASIGSSAFLGCSGLTSLSFPSGITSIGSSAFLGCSGLTSIYVYAEKMPKLGTNMFDDCDAKKCTVYVPKGTYDDYWLSEFGYFENIVEFDPTGINNVITSNDAKELSRYSLNGQRLSAPTKGLNIVKYSDGSVKKVAVQ